MNLKLPSLISVEADILRRGLRSAVSSPDKGITPVEGGSDLPEIVLTSDRITSAYKRVFQSAAEATVAELPIKDIELAIISNNVSTVFDAFIRDAISRHLSPQTKESVQSSYLAGAKVGALDLEPFGVVLRQQEIRFDLINANAVQWAEKRAGRFIADVTDGQIRMVSDLIAESIKAGRTPAQVAGDLRLFIGLDSRRARAVTRFRDRLEDQGLSSEDVARRTERYSRASLASRATVIARSEILQSATHGQLSLWHMASQEGYIDKKKTSRKWIATQDDLLDVHLCEPMAGEMIALNDQWSLPDGSLIDVPPESHPGCRCSERLVFEK